MLQLGIRLHDAEKLPLDRLLPALRGKGFTCCHLALSKSFPETPCTPSSLTPGYANYLKRESGKGGVDIATVGVPAGMGEMDYSGIMAYVKREKPFLFATLEDTKPENAAFCAAAMQEAYEKA